MAKKKRALSGRHDGIVITPRDGKVMARVWMADGQGGGKYRSKRWATVEQAETWAQDEVAKLRTGAETIGTGKVAALAPLYMEQMELRGTGEIHRAQVGRVFSLFKRAGAVDLRDRAFETKVLRAIVDHKAIRNGQITSAPASPAYQRKLLSMAKSFTKWAADRRHVAYNPLAGARLAKPERSSKETWTLDELRTLVSDAARLNLSNTYRQTKAAVTRNQGSKSAAAKDLDVCSATIYNRLKVDDPGDDHLWLAGVLGIYTGARPSEVRAMTWGMIDWKGGDIVLPANAPGNKTKSERRIRLMDELHAILKPRAGVGSALIVSKAVADMKPGTFSESFKHYCGRLGVTELGPHTLRHCCGSLMTAMSIQPVQVLLQLGHDSPIVSKRYSESAPKYREAKGWGDQFQLRERPVALPVKLERNAQ